MSKLLFLILTAIILISGCQTTNPDDQLLNAALEKAYQNGAKECDALREDLKEKCISELNTDYLQMAFESKDVSFCEKYKGETMITKCKDNYYISMSIEQGEDMCNLISDETTKEDCNNAKNA